MATDWTVTHGDCLDWLRTLPDASADALVTDPPAGIGFMGKDWDGDKGGRAQWVAWLTSIMRECNRVLKPGAHALVWALPRTSHWTATAVEDAGFEVRDVVTHLFGSGFPKSLDVGKAIDARVGAVREVVGTKRGTTSAETGRGMPGKATGMKQVGCDVPITAPATPEAAQWSGWGTALKPASEHWILARKPLAGTVAANVLAHGVGGINVDGCRIAGAKPDTTRGAGGAHGTLHPIGAQGRIVDDGLGRWPANIILSHAPECKAECAHGCAVATLDEQSGISTSSGGASLGRLGERTFGSFALDRIAANTGGLGDTGGASRFFYVAKASRSERSAGCDGLPWRAGSSNARGYTDDVARGVDRNRPTANHHPTVKPLDLMRYLVRLITPPGGLVLDPFTGSGSTGCAAVLEGFRFAGCEREAEYVEIARARIAHHRAIPQQRSLF